MIENIFLLALAMVALSGFFTLGFIGAWLYFRIFEGKDAARQFIEREF